MILLLNFVDIKLLALRYSILVYHFPSYKFLFGEEIPHTYERDRYLVHYSSSFLTLHTQTNINN